MSVFHRWIILCLIVLSVITLAAIFIPATLMPHSTLVFRAEDGKGTYEYYYDYRTQMLHLNKEFQLNSALFAPNGEYAVYLNHRGIDTVFIKLVTADNELISLGEVPVNLLAHAQAKWAADSESFYVLGRTDDGVSIYNYNIVHRELTEIAEFELLSSLQLRLEYDYENDYLALVYGDSTGDSIYQIYDLETAERWTLKGYHISPLRDWKTYLSIIELGEQNRVLGLVSHIDNTTQLLPLPSEGRLLNTQLLSDNLVLVTSMNPYASYILDLETLSYTAIADFAVISLASDGSAYAFAMEYRAYRNYQLDKLDWYKIDLENRELLPFLDAYPARSHALRYPESFSISPDKRFIAMFVSRPVDLGGNSIEIVSLETGELVNRSFIPSGLVLVNWGEEFRVLEWFES